MTYALALIVPVAHKMTADAVAIALGYTPVGEETYTCYLSIDGNAPATHCGCHSRADDDFVALIEAMHNGAPAPPANWAAMGSTASDVEAMAQSLMYRKATLAEYTTNFNDCLAAVNLKRVEANV